MQKILENIESGLLSGVSVALILSDNQEAQGLNVAKNYGIPCYVMNIKPHLKVSIGREEESNIAKRLKNLGVDLICLAGFMRIVKHDLLRCFKNRIINIHPSLLPQYPGLNTHERALAHKEKKSGATVHVVNQGMDTGKILAQAEVFIDKNETKESLSKKVLEKEHVLYSGVIAKIRDKIIPLPIEAPFS